MTGEVELLCVPCYRHDTVHKECLLFTAQSSKIRKFQGKTIDCTTVNRSSACINAFGDFPELLTSLNCCYLTESAITLPVEKIKEPEDKSE